MSKNHYDQLQLSSYLADNNAAYIEDLYERYLQDALSVDEQWRVSFSLLEDQALSTTSVSHHNIRESLRELARKPKFAATVPMGETIASKQENVDALIAAYRRFGHFNAQIDPLGTHSPVDVRLTLEHHQLSQADFPNVYLTRGLLEQSQATLKEIYERLKLIYCGTVGIEYSRISDEEERHWLRDYAEHHLAGKPHSDVVKKSILQKLIAAAGWEKYLDTKYPGQRRFSAEGSDSMIPLLDELVKRARAYEVHEIMIGMAHRGRLNVLVNVMGKSTKEIYQEFDGTKEYGLTTGDVKYHCGFSSDVVTDMGPMHLSLAFNPSHLEFINPVVMGSVRARQERCKTGKKRDYALAVLIHGDAAFAGQGIVMETLNMSQTRAYYVGGTIHVIINNQVGFTTSNARDARSSHYCSDVALMIDAPIFHVNGDDPEAVIAVTQLALDYRMKFHKDVVIDLVSYRRHGHQEVDEPRATQPLMYQVIDKHDAPYQIYAKKLMTAGVVTQTQVDQWWDEYRDRLDQGLQVVETLQNGLSHHYAANWTPFLHQKWGIETNTAVAKEKLQALGEILTTLPADFVLQRNVNMIVTARQKMIAGELPLDWGCAENLAYITLLDEGHPVRLTGEDSRRGTFFHRHAFYFDQKTGREYMPLAHVRSDQSHIQIYDSLLSEAGPIGFEYGYSTADPHSLVMWEAQFGDFANGGQVIIDQFLSSGWQKWNRLSGLVMLLPHGNEGLGPEHSSARLERFLQLCAQDNIQVFVPTTPAQIFHLLRRQVLRPYRSPLIVMSPKSLLRHKLAVSTLEDLSQGRLQLIIPEIENIKIEKVKRVILTCGKIYYELLQKRQELNLDNIVIIRIEQLYPFPYEQLTAELARYSHVQDIIWCQEEPKNQGAWFCSRDRLHKCLSQNQRIRLVSRLPMAAPAAGYSTLYKKFQQEIVDEALDI